MNIAAVFIVYFGIKEALFHRDTGAWRGQYWCCWGLSWGWLPWLGKQCFWPCIRRSVGNWVCRGNCNFGGALLLVSWAVPYCARWWRFSHLACSCRTEAKKRNRVKYIWSLKEKNIEYKITWKILGKAHSYSNRTKKCNLCLFEKFHIICHQDKASLNRRSELVNHCRHADKIPAEKHLAQAQTPRPDRLGCTTLRSFSHCTSTDMFCSLQTAARWTYIVNCICLILHVCTCWNL